MWHLPARLLGTGGNFARGCESAWGPGADRRARPLIRQILQGSLNGADLQLRKLNRRLGPEGKIINFLINR
jgi:hypothetical protein